jgi:phosphopantothenoylcysteine decarboxylase
MVAATGDEMFAAPSIPSARRPHFDMTTTGSSTTGSSTTGPSTFGGRLLIGATGAGAVALLPMYLSALRGRFDGTVTVFMTHTAAEFLPPHTVALFADRVVTGESAATWPRENHASLSAEHDMLAVLPATANMLSVTATGAAPNLLAATILTSTFPVVFFPVMSGEMWGKPAVQRNVERIRADGHHVVDPQWGPRYDVGLGSFVESPMPPAPPHFIETVRTLMPTPT